MDINPIKNWLPNVRKPIIISGPCSAESRGQVIQTCSKLSKSGKVSILRAGIWKPRTRPNSFEGVGIPALEWLKNVRLETGLKVIINSAVSND